MATSLDYVEYICDQIRGTGAIRYRKMFGEYMVYINDKPIILVCDNTPFIKMAECIHPLMENASTGCPYDGAKLHYILNIDNLDESLAAIRMLEEITPIPKPKNKKRL
jgi:TfoX/Sxy family transcriptional regulator of competence genes